MTSETYRLTFFVNATHTVTINGTASSHHPHTFEINCYIRSSQFIPFEEMENQVNNVLTPINNANLNELSVFKERVPTLENITRYLNAEITQALKELGCTLVQIEVAESPVGSFIIDNGRK